MPLLTGSEKMQWLVERNLLNRGLACAFAAVLLIAGLQTAYGQAAEHQHIHSSWFTAQTQDGTKTPCCGDLARPGKGGDAYYVEVKLVGDQYFVYVDEDWRLYPRSVAPYLYNPTGRNVLWYNKIDGAQYGNPGTVYYNFLCLRLATGA